MQAAVELGGLISLYELDLPRETRRSQAVLLRGCLETLAEVLGAAARHEDPTQSTWEELQSVRMILEERVSQFCH